MNDDLDDLFGETALPLQLHVPLSQAVVRRLNEASLNGCCQKVAWSKSGAIAYVGPDDRHIILQHLLCDPADGEWKLSKPYPVEDTAVASGAAGLAHLAWDHINNCLVVADTLGRLSIYQLFIAINRPMLTRRCTLDAEDDLATIVGLQWLNNGPPASFYKPTVKKDGQWTFTLTQQKSSGPKNPANKPSLVVVGRNGVVRLIYQDKENRWQDIRANTDSIIDPLGLLTHAAMCADKGARADSIMLATHSVDRALRVYRLIIDFGQSVLTTQHIAAVANCLPPILSEPDSSPSFNAGTALPQLTTFQLVPPGPESKSRSPTDPFVLTVFSNVTSDLQAGDAIQTLVCKWNLSSEKNDLHPAFQEFAAKKPTVKPVADTANRLRLERQKSVVIPKALLSVQHINLSTCLAFCFSDGSVEFRDSRQLEILPPDKEGQISGLGQIGFIFPAGRSCLHVAMSPNSYATFTIDEHNLPAITLMQYNNADSQSDIGEGLLETVNEAFVSHLCIALGAMAISCPDDILSTIRLFAGQYLNDQLGVDYIPSLGNYKTFNRRLISGLYRVLGVSLDHALDDQPDQTLRNSFFQRILGIQAALGYPGEQSLRPVEGLIAIVMLNLRHLLLCLLACSPKKTPVPENPLKKPDTIVFLLPLVSWYLNLASFMVDEVFSMRKDFDDVGVLVDHLDANLINQNLRQSHSSALLLLFISTSRSVLRHVCRFLTMVASEGKELHNGTPLGRAHRELENALKNSPVSIHEFDKLLSQLDTSIRSTYQSTHASETDRKDAEGQMLIQAEIPQVLTQPVKTLLFSTLDAVKEEINEAELYFLDVGRLGLTPDQTSRKRQRRSPLDDMTKTPLRKDARVRRCTRCCAHSEVVIPKPNVNTILLSMARQCYCGSSWMLLDSNENGTISQY